VLFSFLANVNMPSLVRLSLSVCPSSVTLVRPTQSVKISGNFFAIWFLGHPLTSTEHFCGDRPRGTPPSGV